MAKKAAKKKSSKRAAAKAKGKKKGTRPRRKEVVRIGVVGVGDQGSYHLDCALGIEGVEVPAVCDVNDAFLYRAKRWVEGSGRPEPRLYTDYEALCGEEDLDLVICSTSWKYHTPVLLEAMRNGSNAVSEVPIVQTVAEAWALVETYEKTKKWGTMGFKPVHSALSNMIRLGIFGDVIHCEDGYVHDLRLVKYDPEREPWRLQHSVDQNGCLYPDHPTCRIIPLMNVNHGDRFEYLVSMSSRAVMLNEYARQMFGPGHPYATKKMKQGDYNCTLLRTVNGSMYTLNFDTNTPHPRGFFRMQGTKGVFFQPKGMESQIYVDGVSPEPHRWEPAAPYLKKYEHPVIKTYKPPKRRRALRGHAGGGRATPLYWHRLVEAVRSGKVSDFDVYDSVTSSVITPLTEMSVAKGSQPVKVPDFTRGKWKKRKPFESK